MDRDMLKVVAFVVIGLLLGSMMFGGMIMDRLADKVIDRMDKPYSPSPYGPGLDPDRLDGHRTRLIIENDGEPVKFDEKAWESSRQED